MKFRFSKSKCKRFRVCEVENQAGSTYEKLEVPTWNYHFENLFFAGHRIWPSHNSVNSVSLCSHHGVVKNLQSNLETFKLKALQKKE